MKEKLMQKLHKHQALRKDKKGFTLIEIIVVLAILALLIAIAIPTMNGVLNDAQDKVVLADARAAYVGYMMVSTEKDAVTAADITKILDNAAAGMTVGADVDAKGNVTKFYYADSRLKDKHVEMPLSTGTVNKATIVDGAIPSESLRASLNSH